MDHKGFLLDTSCLVGLLVPDDPLAVETKRLLSHLGESLGKSKQIFIAETSLKELMIVLLRLGYEPKAIQEHISILSLADGITIVDLSSYSFLKSIYKTFPTKVITESLKENSLRTSDFLIAVHALALRVPLVTFDEKLYKKVRDTIKTYTLDKFALKPEDELSFLCVD